MEKFLLNANFLVETIILLFEVPERLRKPYSYFILFLWVFFSSAEISAEFASELPATIAYIIMLASRSFELGLRIKDHLESSPDRDGDGPKES